jgi:hypothetical protein
MSSFKNKFRYEKVNMVLIDREIKKLKQFYDLNENDYTNSDLLQPRLVTVVIEFSKIGKYNVFKYIFQNLLSLIGYLLLRLQSTFFRLL